MDQWRPVLLALTVSPLAGAETPAALWKSDIQPIIENYCFDCHGEGVDKGDLDFEDFESIEDMIADRERWKRIRGHLEQHLMPPPDEFQPKQAERDKVIEWIDMAIFPVDPDNPDPGRVTLRRLNRTEYENTIQDLLGVKVNVQDILPPDDSGYGFDNIGDVLTLSPVHMERFLEAARIGLDSAIRLGPMPYPTKQYAGKNLEGPGHRSDEGHYLLTNGQASTVHQFYRPGTYKVTIIAGGTKGGDSHPIMQLKLGSEIEEEWKVDASTDRPKGYSKNIKVTDKGKVELAAVFTNDFFDDKLANNKDRNLLVRSIHVEGPFEGPRAPKPKSHLQIYGERADGASDDEWALDVFRRFARRAFRRPAEPGEVERYLHFVHLAKKQGQNVEFGIRLGLEAMLVSPSFLFREEPQPEPDNADQIYQIDEHTLATKLSYFLWSTMPDERLMRLASVGELRNQLDGEIERMLDSPRANRMVNNFTGQWLQLRDVRSKQLYKKVYPKYNYRLPINFREETELLFNYLVKENRPLSEFLDADYTFLNDELAKHYGIKGVEGKEFRKVSLKDTPRRGVLSHGSFHIITSQPKRTSPVLRGKYVLENLLGTPPPPPPPNVAQLAPPNKETEGMTFREQMELHRDKPDCSSCHALMDPIGFGLENYDADGSYRKMIDGKKVDASGKLANGKKFEGADELREILLKDHRNDYYRAVASKMLTYALGRGTDWYDKPALDQIVRDTNKAGGGTRDLIHAIVKSVPFQYRRGEG